MEPAIALSGVTRGYEGFTLRDVSFTLPRGYIMGLIGPNGAGKTTLIKMMLGLVRREAGDLRVLGADPAGERADVKARIGFIHETSAFPGHLRVGAIAAMVARFYPTWDQSAFERLRREFELPLDTRLGAWSRGTRTKLGLALALSHRAELLLLDEPTSGLDPLARRDLLERLGAFISDGQASVLFSTHLTTDLERVTDYITFIQHGQLVLASTRDDVMEKWGVVRGAPALLDAGTRRFLKGYECSPLAFTGLTDDVEAARRRFAGLEVVVERASLEDIMFYTGRSC